MRLLLDTLALLWWLGDDRSLSTEAREAIADGKNVVAVSAASAWEISIKSALGKLDAPEDLEAQIELNGFIALPITLADGVAAGLLPRHHDDPFDRMLVSQADSGSWIVVARDTRFSLYGVDLLPA